MIGGVGEKETIWCRQLRCVVASTCGPLSPYTALPCPALFCRGFPGTSASVGATRSSGFAGAGLGRQTSPRLVPDSFILILEQRRTSAPCSLIGPKGAVLIRQNGTTLLGGRRCRRGRSCVALTGPVVQMGAQDPPSQGGRRVRDRGAGRRLAAGWRERPPSRKGCQGSVFSLDLSPAGHQEPFLLRVFFLGANGCQP